MKKLLFFICPALVGTAFTGQAQAQTPNKIASYSAQYMQQAGDHAALFRGRLQTRLPGNVESLYLRERGRIERDDRGKEVAPQPVPPFASYGVGDLFYDGVLYVGVRMRLDLYRDELVVAPPDESFSGVVLDPSRFGYADLRGYRVIRIPAGSPSGLAEGYYQQLHEGIHTVLKKEIFQFREAELRFTRISIRYYVEKDGAYHSVGKRKGPILRLLGDHRAELNDFVRLGGLDIWNDTDRALVGIVSEYERLTGR